MVTGLELFGANCCHPITTPGLLWDFNYVALLVELDYQMMLKAQIFGIIW